jgi:hypothetical protein
MSPWLAHIVQTIQDKLIDLAIAGLSVFAAQKVIGLKN